MSVWVSTAPKCELFANKLSGTTTRCVTSINIRNQHAQFLIIITAGYKEKGKQREMKNKRNKDRKKEGIKKGSLKSIDAEGLSDSTVGKHLPYTLLICLSLFAFLYFSISLTFCISLCLSLFSLPFAVSSFISGHLRLLRKYMHTFFGGF